MSSHRDLPNRKSQSVGRDRILQKISSEAELTNSYLLFMAMAGVLESIYKVNIKKRVKNEQR